MEKDSTNGQMAGFMKENGHITRSMEKESTSGQMDKCMMVNS